MWYDKCRRKLHADLSLIFVCWAVVICWDSLYPLMGHGIRNYDKQKECGLVDQIIVYGSRYGTTRRYAEELAKRVGIKAVAYSQTGDLSKYRTVVFLGGLYAGSVLGLKKTCKKLSQDDGQEIIIVTVGLADPANAENEKHIRQGLCRQLPERIYQKASFFHLRGGIDYQKLSLVHKIMMWAMVQSLRRIPQEKQTLENRAIIETYHQKVDLMDFERLDEILKIMR